MRPVHEFTHNTLSILDLPGNSSVSNNLTPHDSVRSNALVNDSIHANSSAVYTAEVTSEGFPLRRSARNHRLPFRFRLDTAEIGVTRHSNVVSLRRPRHISDYQREEDVFRQLSQPGYSISSSTASVDVHTLFASAEALSSNDLGSLSKSCLFCGA